MKKTTPYFEYKGFEYKLILLSKSGSRLFGTHWNKGEYPVDKNYESDHDYKGIIVSKPKDKLKINTTLLSEINYNDEENDLEDRIKFNKLLNKTYNINIEVDADITLFEIKKFFELTANDNPNSLDIIFPKKSNFLYLSEEGKYLYNNNHNFLTKNSFKSLYEYGRSQLVKINTGEKWVSKFPKTNNVIDILKISLKDEIIDYKFIKNFFSNDLALNLTDTFKSNLPTNWKDFENYILKNNLDKKFNISIEEFNQYRKHEIKDFINITDLKNSKFSINSKLEKLSKLLNLNVVDNKLYGEDSLLNFLNNKATMRKRSESMYFIYEPPNDNNWGVFTKYGDMKSNDHSDIGEFLFLLTVNRSQFIKSTKNVEALWKWRMERNPKRAILEKLFGYDVKNGAHLYRLIKKSFEIGEKATYVPELSSKDEKTIREILTGKYSLEELKKLVEELKNKTNFTNEKIIDEIDIELLNKLIVNIYFYDEYKIKNDLKNNNENDILVS